MHDNSEVARVRAAVFDTNADRFISQHEFKELMELMVTREPRVQGTSFDDFVKSADANKDGKVSIEECAQWIDRVLKLK